MDINTAIIINDQYTNTSAAIDNCIEQLNDTDLNGKFILTSTIEHLEECQREIYVQQKRLKEQIQL